MVKETRIIIGLSDIKTLRFQCNHCSGVLAIKLEATERMPEHCPLCTSRWQVNGDMAANVLRDLRHLLHQDKTVEILFEVDAE